MFILKWVQTPLNRGKVPQTVEGKNEIPFGNHHIGYWYIFLNTFNAFFFSKEETDLCYFGHSGTDGLHSWVALYSKCAYLSNKITHRTARWPLTLGFMVTGIFGVTGNTLTHLSRIFIYWRECQTESLMGLKLLSFSTLFVYPTFSFFF